MPIQESESLPSLHPTRNNYMLFSENLSIIRLLLEAFIHGPDRSLDASSKIEELLEETFPHDEEIQDYITIFASYRPEGGLFLFNTSQILQKSHQLLALLADKYPLTFKQPKSEP